MSALARFRRTSRAQRRRLQAVIGLLGALLAIGTRWAPLAAGSAANVSLEGSAVAVTGLIAGWLGSAVLLLLLTLVTLASAGTLGAALLSLGRDVVVGICSVLLGKGARYVIVAMHERNGLRRRLARHQQRILSIRSHAKAEAARAVSGYEAELRGARRLVESAQRSSGHFVAMMSHEIRTPLHGLMATIDMLRDEPLSAEGRHRVAIARACARTLLNIANDILDLSRIEAGSFPLERKPFDLERVLREVVEEARARAQSLGLDLRVIIETPLPRSLIGDPARIKQILTNLVSNALKFTNAGLITVQAWYDGAQCTIDVIDTGEGVPRGKQAVIFEPFVQAQSMGAHPGGGAGLGLPISRRLSEAMGGGLVLLRTSPDGSTFRVTLPLEASAEEALEDQSQRILKNPPGRILVVEDHPANQYVAKSLLESLDCTVTLARTGVEALEALSKQTFDLVLMDCQLPDMDGYETTRRMRTFLHRYIPVIAITANAMGDDKQRCLDAGMDDFLSKPFTRSTLCDLLCKWLVPAAQTQSESATPERIADQPVLAGVVFEELWESLQWRIGPLRKIYESFLAVARETLDMLNCATATGDGTVLARRLHTLLGSAGMVGARQVEMVAAWLQEVVKADRRADLEAGRVLLASALRRFETELERRLDSLAR